MIDINNLGTFSDINAVWAAYPEGGNEGDYLYIGNTKYRWGKYERVWKTAGEVTESPARKLVTNYGDMAVNNDLHVGGTLYYHRLAGYDLGLFSSSTALSTAHPTPKVGQWAFVVHPTIEDKYQIYTCATAGTWTLSVEETTLDVLGFDKFEETLELMQQIANGRALTGYRAALTLSDLPTQDVDPTLGYIVANKLYVWVGTDGDTLDGKYLNCGELRGAKGEKGNAGISLGDDFEAFADISDLEKTTSQDREAMVPDGNVVTEIVGRTYVVDERYVGQYAGVVSYTNGARLNNSGVLASNNNGKYFSVPLELAGLSAGNVVKVDTMLKTTSSTGVMELAFFATSTDPETGHPVDVEVGGSCMEGTLQTFAMSPTGVYEFEGYVTIPSGATHLVFSVYNDNNRSVHISKVEDIVSTLNDSNALTRRHIMGSMWAMTATDAGNGYKGNMGIDIYGNVISSDTATVRVDYYTLKLPKDTLIHYTGTASTTRSMRYCISDTNPGDEDNPIAVGDEVEVLLNVSKSGDYDDYIVMPRDGWFLYSWYNSSWSNRSITFYVPGKIQDEVVALQSGKMNALTQDYTSSVRWCSGASYTPKDKYATTTTNGGVTTVTINTSASGGRFGILFPAMPVGRYTVEFDVTLTLSGETISWPSTWTGVGYYKKAIANSGGGSQAGIRASTVSSTISAGKRTIILDHLTEDSFYLAFSFNGVLSVGTVLTITNFSLTLTTTDIDDVISNISGDKGEELRIKNLAAEAKFVNSSPDVPSLGLLHFSDIHGDQEAANTIINYANILSEYIDDLICTGDSAEYFADGTGTYPYGASWWTGNSGLAESSLFALGNHDGATSSATTYDQKEGGAAWDGKGQEYTFDTYFADYLEGWGATPPTGYDDDTSDYYKACYWHKDYEDQKVRLISVDCIHRFDGVYDPQTKSISTAGIKKLTIEQEVWLQELMEDTLDSENDAYGYSVIVMCHYPLDDFTSTENEQWNDTTHKWEYNQSQGRVKSGRTMDTVNFHDVTTTSLTLDKRFCMRNRTTSTADYGYSKGTENNMAAIIKKFMDAGGKFVAWVCGHCHDDYMYYPSNYPGILVVANNQAGALRGSGVAARQEGMRIRTAANYISIDTLRGQLSLVRIGLTHDRNLTSRQYLCYDYINKKVISEG